MPRLTVFPRALRCATMLSILLLTACASTGPRSAATVASYRDTLDLSGRLSVNYEKDGQPETLSGKFNWSQTPAAIDVTLASPLGQTLATIRVTPESATLTQADRAPKVARDIDTLTAQTLGWSLPVAGLRDWLQGYATGVDGQRVAASPARNEVLTADGWHVSFVSWQDDAAAVPQPRRIDARRIDARRIDARRTDAPRTASASAGADQLAIRIVIDPPQ